MSGYVGHKSETTWGVKVTPDVFRPVLESRLNSPPNLIRSNGIRSGRRTHNTGRPGLVVVGGTVREELANVTIAPLFTQLFGAVSTTGSNPYTHTYTPGAQTGSGKSMTLQTVIDDTGGTANPFTATGAKVESFDLSCAVGQLAELSWDWTGRKLHTHRSVTDLQTTNSSATVTSATANFTVGDKWSPISGTNIPANSYIGLVNSTTSVTLSSSAFTHTAATATGSGTNIAAVIGIAAASASYSSSYQPFSFIEGTISTAAGLVPIASARQVSFKGTKGLNSNRGQLGSQYINEQLEVERFTYTFDVVADFEATYGISYIRQALASDTNVLSLYFTNGTQTLTVTANAHVLGDLPSLTTNGLEEQALKFEVAHATSDATAMTAVLVTSDSSAA